MERGYLVEPYKIFYLEEQHETTYEAHYHDFHKLIFVLEGHLNYYIEGKRYLVGSGDLILVRRHETHTLRVIGDTPYRRLIIYIKPNFLDAYGNFSLQLTDIFSKTNHGHYEVVGGIAPKINKEIQRLLTINREETYGKTLMTHASLLMLMTYLHEWFFGDGEERLPVYEGGDDRIMTLIHYIGDHLDETLSTQVLGEVVYLNKYHLMRLFKQETGFSIHDYITQKRLAKAAEYIISGESLAESALRSGYKDYSVFLRAFKKRYGMSPKKYYQDVVVASEIKL